MKERQPIGVQVLANLALVLSCSLGAGTAFGQAGSPLPPELEAAWDKAGFAVGWMRVNERCRVEFVSQNQRKAGDVPAFLFRESGPFCILLPHESDPFWITLPSLY